MRSVFGERLVITVEGESHGPSVSASVKGFPKGLRIDTAALDAMMARRRGGGALATPRREEDRPIFLSGILDGVTTGEELRVLIENKNVRSQDYSGYTDTPRPSHADYTAQMRYGSGIDLRGGGHFSARLTAPLVAIGALCKQWLLSRGIAIGAHLAAVGSVCDRRFSPTEVSEKELLSVLRHELPVLDPAVICGMRREIEAAAADADSVGGIVECAAVGVPAGVGSPLGAGLENRLSAAMFVLGGVRGIEFGDGFAAAAMRGSEHNDPYTVRDGRILTETNHAGGIVGGISTGMPIVFRVAMKPTASIGREQRTVSLSRMEPATIAIKGRHDPCIALRAVPCVEAMTAIVMTDAILEAEEDTERI
jgi:chorismate synthase